MFNPQGFVNSVKQEIVRLYSSKPEKDRATFKIGNMFMITWSIDENAKRKDDWTDAYFKSVKLSSLVLEGAYFSDRMKLVDHSEKLVQEEGF